MRRVSKKDLPPIPNGKRSGAGVCPQCGGTGWKHSEREIATPVTGKRRAVKYSFVEECDCLKAGRKSA